MRFAHSILRAARLFVLALIMLGVPHVGVLTSSALAEVPWEAAEGIRRDLASMERVLMLGGDKPKVRSRVQELFTRALNSHEESLQSELPSEQARLLERAFQKLRQALEKGETRLVAYARQEIWTALLHGAFIRVRQALARGDAATAQKWLEIREYARSAHDTAAAEAAMAAASGRMPPERAWEVIERELLRIYASNLRTALQQAITAGRKGYAFMLAAEAAKAAGFARILDENLKKNLETKTYERFAFLLKQFSDQALQGSLKGAQNSAQAALKLLQGYSPTPLSEEELSRRVVLLSRFLKLTYLDFKAGVKNGKITVPIEYAEAVTFSSRARDLLDELQATIRTKSPEAGRKLAANIDEMIAIVQARGSLERIRQLSDESLSIVKQLFPDSSSESSHQAAFQILPGLLDSVVSLARQGDYSAAELKRLEAYAFFDPDIEQHLVPRSPTLALKLENLFWEGSASQRGLGLLIQRKAQPERIATAVDEIRKLLTRAEEALNTKLGATGAFVQALAIILREGLEAILVIAAVLGALRAMGSRGHVPYIAAGVVLAIAASFALALAADVVLNISTANRELLEGITALLAAAVLIYVTHWIFHKAYVKDWMTFVKEKVRQSVTQGHKHALGALGFFVVFREGFETVLFYEALLMDAPAIPVLGGFIAGVAGTAAIAFALLYYGLHLPLHLFFKATGLLLMILSIILVGAGIRGLQTAGLVSATPVPGFPESPFLQLYLGIYPVAEALLAQAAVILIYAVGWLWLRVRKTRKTRLQSA